MTKEVNEKDLEQVAGGGAKGYKSEDKVKFNFNINENVNISTPSGFVFSAITSRGYYKNAAFYFPCYYLNVFKYPNESGWYDEKYLNHENNDCHKVRVPVTVYD